MRPTSSTRSSLIEMSLVARQRRHGHGETRRAAARRRRTPGARECARTSAGRDLAAELARQPVQRQARWRAAAASWRVLVGHAAHQRGCPGETSLQQFDRAGQAAHRVHRVLRLLEAHRGVGAQLDRRRRLADRRRLEIRALQHHRVVVFALIALSQPPITPASAIGAACVGDHQIRRIERVRLRRSARGSARRACAGRTKIVPPCSRSASNACIGCASSAMT